MSFHSFPPIRPSPGQILDAICQVEKFSPAPRILARAMALMRDDHCEVGSISSLIQGDAALSADMMRIANSAYFSSGVQIQSVEQALQKIGFGEATRLLNTAVARVITRANLDNYCISAEDFWAESLFNGIFMEGLARATGRADPGEAYTAGLLRYIGRLAINHGIQALGGGLFWVGAEPLTQWERENVGFTQAQAGAVLLRRWNFPAVLVEACEHQDSPQTPAPPNWYASALHFIASVIPQDFDLVFQPVFSNLIDSDFLHPHGPTLESVEAVFNASCETYHEVRAQLG